MKITLAQIRKAIVAGVGVVAEAVSAGLVPEPAAKWVGIAIAVLTAAGVYAVPNAQAAKPAAPPKA
jgi:hypothetical protein